MAPTRPPTFAFLKILLEALRSKLGIWTREHLILEHHPDIFLISDFSSAYVSARNHLLITGLVLTHDNKYILGDEVAVQIRRTWGIDLENDSYHRLLNYLTKIQLHNVLEKTGLNVTGSKEEQIQHIINALVFAEFDSPPMYEVLEGKKQVGTLDSAFVESVPIPFFVLGGIEWSAVRFY